MTPQQLFNKTYISSAEICRTLKISRATLLTAKRTGVLPQESSIMVEGMIQIWYRDEVSDALAAWKAKLDKKRQAA